MTQLFKHILAMIFLSSTFTGCDENARGVSKSLVTTVEKLNSPNNKYSFYRYYVKPSMAFGSGSVRMTFLPTTEDFDYMSSDFFTLKGSGPVVIGWQNDTTIKLIQFASWPNAEQEPFLTDTKRVKNITVEISYYNMHSSGGIDFSFDSLEVKGDTIVFSNDKETKSFIKGQDEISFYTDTFNIRQIEIVYDSTAKTKIQVNSDNWKLIPSKKMNFSEVLRSGVLIEKKLE